MVVEVKQESAWSGLKHHNVPSNNKIYKFKGYKGPSIVNEYTLKKEVTYNKRLPDKDDDGNTNESKKSYEELMKNCESGDFQGTMDENKYFRVVTPVERIIKGRVFTTGKGKTKRSRKEPDTVIVETKKMFFSNFFQYLEYIDFKNGARPREEFFSNEKDFDNAYSVWEKKRNKTSHGVNGTNWRSYTSDNRGVIEYLNRRDKEENEHNEYVKNRREELMKIKKVTTGYEDQKKWTVASGRKSGKITQKFATKHINSSIFNSIITDNDKTHSNKSSNRAASPERPLLLFASDWIKM